MDEHLIADALGTTSEEFHLLDLQMVAWGRSLYFNCYAMPERGEPIPFGLYFVDIRDQRWTIYTHMVVEDHTPFPETELVGFRLGRGSHRKPAYLLTDHFGLVLNYERLYVVQGEKMTELEETPIRR